VPRPGTRKCSPAPIAAPIRKARRICTDGGR
jgi:hypothetical protein